MDHLREEISSPPPPPSPDAAPCDSATSGLKDQNRCDDRIDNKKNKNIFSSCRIGCSKEEEEEEEEKSDTTKNNNSLQTSVNAHHSKNRAAPTYLRGTATQNESDSGGEDGEGDLAAATTARPLQPPPPAPPMHRNRVFAPPFLSINTTTAATSCSSQHYNEIAGACPPIACCGGDYKNASSHHHEGSSPPTSTSSSLSSFSQLLAPAVMTTTRTTAPTTADIGEGEGPSPTDLNVTKNRNNYQHNYHRKPKLVNNFNMFNTAAAAAAAGGAATTTPLSTTAGALENHPRIPLFFDASLPASPTAGAPTATATVDGKSYYRDKDSVVAFFDVPAFPIDTTVCIDRPTTATAVVTVTAAAAAADIPSPLQQLPPPPPPPSCKPRPCLRLPSLGHTQPDETLDEPKMVVPPRPVESSLGRCDSPCPYAAADAPTQHVHANHASTTSSASTSACSRDSPSRTRDALHGGPACDPATAATPTTTTSPHNNPVASASNGLTTGLLPLRNRRGLPPPLLLPASASALQTTQQQKHQHEQHLLEMNAADDGKTTLQACSLDELCVVGAANSRGPSTRPRSPPPPPHHLVGRHRSSSSAGPPPSHSLCVSASSEASGRVGISEIIPGVLYVCGAQALLVRNDDDDRGEDNNQKGECAPMPSNEDDLSGGSSDCHHRRRRRSRSRPSSRPSVAFERWGITAFVSAAAEVDEVELLGAHVFGPRNPVPLHCHVGFLAPTGTTGGGTAGAMAYSSSSMKGNEEGEPTSKWSAAEKQQECGGCVGVGGSSSASSPSPMTSSSANLTTNGGATATTTTMMASATSDDNPSSSGCAYFYSSSPSPPPSCTGAFSPMEPTTGISGGDGPPPPPPAPLPQHPSAASFSTLTNSSRHGTSRSTATLLSALTSPNSSTSYGAGAASDMSVEELLPSSASASVSFPFLRPFSSPVGPGPVTLAAVPSPQDRPGWEHTHGSNENNSGTIASKFSSHSSKQFSGSQHQQHQQQQQEEFYPVSSPSANLNQDKNNKNKKSSRGSQEVQTGKPLTSPIHTATTSPLTTYTGISGPVRGGPVVAPHPGLAGMMMMRMMTAVPAAPAGSAAATTTIATASTPVAAGVDVLHLRPLHDHHPPHPSATHPSTPFPQPSPQPDSLSLFFPKNKNATTTTTPNIDTDRRSGDHQHHHQQHHHPSSSSTSSSTSTASCEYHRRQASPPAHAGPTKTVCGTVCSPGSMSEPPLHARLDLPSASADAERSPNQRLPHHTPLATTAGLATAASRSLRLLHLPIRDAARQPPSRQGTSSTNTNSTNSTRKGSSSSTSAGDILPYLEEACWFIDQCRAEGRRVVVFCREGRSRSSTVAIAYCMRTLGCAFPEALALIRRGRPRVDPNFAFCLTLQLRWAPGSPSSPTASTAPPHLATTTQPIRRPTHPEDVNVGREDDEEHGHLVNDDTHTPHWYDWQLQPVTLPPSGLS